MGEGKSEVLQGTLDLMVLKTLYTMGTLHGFGIARRIEQVSDGVLDLNEGTVYTALLRCSSRDGSPRSGGPAKTIGGRGFTRLPSKARSNWSARRKTGSASRA
jgi:PadR family transcriptional regulator